MDYYETSNVAVEDITAESVVGALIRGMEDQVRYLKASISDAQNWLESSQKELLVAEKKLEVLRTLA